MLVKASRPKWAHLHSANIETFRPTVRHTVNHISPLTKATIPWEKNRDLGLFCTTAKPGTSCFLFKHSTKDAFFECGKLLQNIIDRKVKPINLELPNERRKIFVTIHCPKVKVELSTAKGVFPLIGYSVRIRSLCRSIKPQHVFIPIRHLSSMQFPQNNWRPVGREPYIQIVNRTVSTQPVSHCGVLISRVHHVTRFIFVVGRNLDQV